MRVRATARVSAIVALALFAACKPGDDGGNALRNDETAAAPGAAKEVSGRLSLDGGKVLSLKTTVNENRPTVTLSFRLDAQGSAVETVDLSLARDANGNQRCDALGTGWACRYERPDIGTELVFRYDRTENVTRIVSAKWQGTVVPESAISSKTLKMDTEGVTCDLMTGIGCGS